MGCRDEGKPRNWDEEGALPKKRLRGGWRRVISPYTLSRRVNRITGRELKRGLDEKKARDGGVAEKDTKKMTDVASSDSSKRMKEKKQPRT